MRLTQAADTRPLWSRRLLGLLAALPPFAILFLIGRYAVNIPFHDEWGWSVKHVLNEDLLNLRLNRFWNLNNEHRVFVPKLISTALGHVTNLDMRVAIYAKLFFTVCTGLVLAALYRKRAASAPQPAVPIVLSLCLFNVAQWPRWVDVRPLPSTLSILGLAGALWFICADTPTRKRFWGAATCAWISSSSYFSGNVTWVVVGLALVLCRWSLRACIGWFVIAAAVGAQYLLDFMETPTLTGSTYTPSLLEILHFACVFIGSVCSATHRGLPNQTEALFYGVAGISAACWLGWTLCQRTEGGLRRAAPWFAMILWVILNALAAGVGRIPSAGILGARAWRYTVFGGVFWAALGVLAVMVLFETHASVRERSRRVAFGTLGLLLVGLIGGTLGMMQGGGLEAYSRSMREGRASLLLGEYADAHALELVVPSVERFKKRLPRLIERKASFLYGEQVLGLADSKRHDHVSFGRKNLVGENRPIFSVAQGASVGWDLHLQDRPYVKVCFAIASADPLGATLLSVRVITDEESTVVDSIVSTASLGVLEAHEIDVRAWIGEDVTIRFRCEPNSANQALLISPRLVYDVLDRKPQ